MDAAESPAQAASAGGSRGNRIKLYVVAVGNRLPAWVNAGFEEYARRMPKEAALELKALKPETRSEGAPVAKAIEAEGRRILAAIPRDAFKVVLDEKGKTCTTRELASRIEAWRMNGRDVAFAIGGADGHSAEVRERADWTWSLSPLTLPHGLVRVIVAEQLYRAWTIIAGHPYHRE